MHSSDETASSLDSSVSSGIEIVKVPTPSEERRREKEDLEAWRKEFELKEQSKRTGRPKENADSKDEHLGEKLNGSSKGGRSEKNSRE